VAISSFAVLLYFFWNVLSVFEGEAIAGIEEEMKELISVRSRSNHQEMVQEIVERSHPIGTTHRVYLLTGTTDQPAVGNLTSVEGVSIPAREGWHDLLITPARASSSGYLNLRLKVRPIVGGYTLTVGRDISAAMKIREVFKKSSLAAAVIALTLGLTGGYILSRRTLQRIASVNRTAEAIHEGDLRQRIPLQGAGDEFDQLARNLNNMIERIEHLVETMREVTDNVAHDLRSPLNRLRNKIEVTLLREKKGDEYRQVLESAIGDIEEILTIFNAVLRIAQIESSAARDGFEAMDLSSIVSDVVELYLPAAEEKGISIAVEAGPGALLEGDPQLLSQAVANLLDNSIKYTGPRCNIYVEVSRTDDRVTLKVADNGPGIPEKYREAVLGRFVRLDPQRSTPGTGLGLSLVAAVAHRHHASMRLEDNEPGLRVMLSFPPHLTPKAPNATT